MVSAGDEKQSVEAAPSSASEPALCPRAGASREGGSATVAASASAAARPADDLDRLDLYDYHLPPELIASEPLPERDASRLLVVDRSSGRVEHRWFRDLPELLRPGDCLVFNDSRVVPARLRGRRAATGGKWEGLYLESAPDGTWRLLCQTRGRLRPGERVVVEPFGRPARGGAPAEAAGPSGDTPSVDEAGVGSAVGPTTGLRSVGRSGVARGRPADAATGQAADAELVLTLLDVDDEGIWSARPETDADTLQLLERFGTVPLPPYIRRKFPTQLDWERYQTEYARQPGSVAAPTAGLHFTERLRRRLRERGVGEVFVTLHVGIGTFRPVTVDRLSQHRMHSEWCEVSAETVERLAEVRRSGGRIVAVGTTTVRTLETAAQSGQLRPWRGRTDLFIRPPYRFRAVDALITNFHLPRSTLLVLVAAFAGLELTRRAYEEAVSERYRFYSYGDAMLVL